jgi:hypothetical protein
MTFGALCQLPEAEITSPRGVALESSFAILNCKPVSLLLSFATTLLAMLVAL